MITATQVGVEMGSAQWYFFANVVVFSAVMPIFIIFGTYFSSNFCIGGKNPDFRIFSPFVTGNSVSGLWSNYPMLLTVRFFLFLHIVLTVNISIMLHVCWGVFCRSKNKIFNWRNYLFITTENIFLGDLGFCIYMTTCR